MKVQQLVLIANWYENPLTLNYCYCDSYSYQMTTPVIVTLTIKKKLKENIGNIGKMIQGLFDLATRVRVSKRRKLSKAE